MSTVTEDPIRDVVHHVCQTQFSDLPEAAVAAVQRAIIDTVGAGIAGTSSTMSKMVVEMAESAGGRPDARLWGGRVRVPLAEAAYANAVTARCLELDDVHEGSPDLGLGFGGHVSVMIIPAVLAAAEASAEPVSGADVITAIAIGSDLVPRIRMAAGTSGRFGWEGPTIGPFGVAAAVGKLWKFDVSTMANAMGAAYSQCCGNVQGTVDGAWDVWLNAGLGARGGMVAANLARHGHRGTSAPLLGVSGLYNLYFGGEFHPEALLGGLGSRFEGANLSVKIYSSCRYTHNAIYATGELAHHNGIAVDEIEEIWVGTSTSGLKMVAVDSEGNMKCRPDSISAAQFSLPFVVAVGLKYGQVFPDNLTEQMLRDPEVLALAEKVVVEVAAGKDELNATQGYPPDDIRITTRDGQVTSGCIPFTKGHPLNPVTFDELVAKFDHCCEISERPPAEDARLRFLESVRQLAVATDCRDLVAGLFT
jgi:2-methylcitrate dehydratase PrpD